MGNQLYLVGVLPVHLAPFHNVEIAQDAEIGEHSLYINPGLGRCQNYLVSIFLKLIEQGINTLVQDILVKPCLCIVLPVSGHGLLGLLAGKTI